MLSEQVAFQRTPEYQEGALTPMPENGLLSLLPFSHPPHMYHLQAPTSLHGVVHHTAGTSPDISILPLTFILAGRDPHKQQELQEATCLRTPQRRQRGGNKMGPDHIQ